MSRILITAIFIGLLLAADNPVQAEPIGGGPVLGKPTVGRGPDISLDYLAEARKYRDDGRYELATQSYVQALSTCRNAANLEIIKRELAGVQLLIKTMR